MITTLRLNFKDPARRKVFYARFGGKMIGLAAVVAMIYAFAYIFSTQIASATPVHSAAADLKAQLTTTISAVNTAWVCVTAFLVFFMQAGFMMLEGGFARTRETSNIMIECIIDTALCGILFYAFGFAFMFGHGNGWIGYHYFFLQGVPHTYTYGGLFDTGVAFMAFFIFQFAFADHCVWDTCEAILDACCVPGTHPHNPIRVMSPQSGTRRLGAGLGWPLHGFPDERIEPLAALAQMMDDFLSHARVPEFGEMIGDSGDRRFMPLGREEFADLVCHIDQFLGRIVMRHGVAARSMMRW